MTTKPPPRPRHTRLTARFRPREDTGSMPLAMLLMLVGVALSGLLAAMTVTQVQGARQATGRAQALHAAQAGLDAALGRLRAVERTDEGYGRIDRLPCQVITGNVVLPDSAAISGGYRASVSYHRADDAALSSCPPAEVPAYAKVRSAGLAAGNAVGRTLEARYTLQTSNANIAGGQVRVHRATPTDFDGCLDGGPMVAGTTVKIMDCVPGAPQQSFAYATDLTVRMPRAQGYPAGLCLDGGLVPVAGAEVKLRVCAAPVIAQQRWIFNGSVNFAGVTGDRENAFCWNAQIPGQPGYALVLGQYIPGGGVLSTCRNSGYTNKENFFADPAVGAGAAGAASMQLVNYAQFGRCIDTPWTPDPGENTKPPYVQAWPCKQAVNAGDVDWNQHWTPEPVSANFVRIYTTTKPNGLYARQGQWCLESPGSTAFGQFVDAAPCPPGLPQNMKWEFTGLTGRYSDSYQIRDYWGNCMAAADQRAVPRQESPRGYRTMKIIVAVCSASTLQKWNADPNALQSKGLHDFVER